MDKEDMTETLLSLLEPYNETITVGSKWLHLKSKHTYEVVAIGYLESSLTTIVVYKGVEGLVWVRPITEFLDGRFVAIMT